ncbi:MAG: hypothetical protein P8178_05065 [Candidatus Thiodiazotropha sp.]
MAEVTTRRICHEPPSCSHRFRFDSQSGAQAIVLVSGESDGSHAIEAEKR